MNKSFVIECCRAGAIGDVLMTTPTVRMLRKIYPDAYIRYVTLNPDLLINNPDIDELSPVSYPSDKQFLFEYPVHKGYPDRPLERHIAHEFAACCDLELDSICGTVHFTDSELGYIRSLMKKFGDLPTTTIHIHAGWSPYKEWPVENWQKVVDHFFGQLAFIQIGDRNEPVLKNVASMVGLLNVRLSAACVYQTDLFVGIDSFPNHVAGAFGKPAVVLFGSTSPTGSGYPTAINLWAGEPCSPCYREYNSISVHPKEPCPYGVKCQKEISIDKVIASIETILASLKPRKYHYQVA